jgi:hypothetical protein
VGFKHSEDIIFKWVELTFTGCAFLFAKLLHIKPPVDGSRIEVKLTGNLRPGEALVFERSNLAEEFVIYHDPSSLIRLRMWPRDCNCP